MSAPLVFQAVLEAGGPSFMPTQIIQVPEAEYRALGGAATRRVLATLNGHPARLSLLPQAGDGRYLQINKELCQQAGLVVGQQLTVTLAPDPAPDHVDLPAELAEALAAWPEAAAAFLGWNGAMRRAMARHVGGAHQPETRARRAVELVGRLVRGGHPFRKE